MKVLFVCTGNLCRSPMAEGMLRKKLTERGCDTIGVASCGTWAGTGHPAMPEAVSAMRARGIDVSAHRSRPLTRKDALAADVIVAMTSVHVAEIRNVAPEVAGKLVLLKELADIGAKWAVGATPQERLAALLAVPRREPRRSLDVDDPIGLPMSAYDRCVNDLESGIEVLAETLCGGTARHRMRT